MPTSYPLETSYLRLTVGGTERTDELLSGTLLIRKVSGGQVDTCSFALKGKESWRGTAGAKPTNGQEVVVETRLESEGTWTKLFGGVINGVPETKIAFATVRWDVQCNDYTHLLQRLLVNETYVNAQVSDIVRDLVEQYSPFVSSSGIAATTTTIDQITFAHQYPIQALQQLAEATARIWYVNPDKVLYFVDPTSADQVCPLQLTDTSQNYQDLGIEPRLDQVRNRVFVHGGMGLSAEIVETYDFDGTDDDRALQLGHRDIIGNVGLIASGVLGNFLAINGVLQTTAQKGVIDESSISNGFMVDVAAGIVSATSTTPTPPDGAKGVFRYRYRLPISVCVEDLQSQKTTAELEGTDYETVIDEDAPLYRWRLDETTGNTAANTGSAGVAASGIMSGSFQWGHDGPLSGGQGKAVRFFGDGYMFGSKAATLPQSGYTIEGWAMNSFGRNAGFTRGLFGGGEATTKAATVYLNPAGNDWGARNGLNVVSALDNYHQQRFDHVALTWGGTGTYATFYVNKKVLSADPPPAGFTSPYGASGILVGKWTYPAGDNDYWNGWIAEPAVYDRPLTPIEIARHYDAGLHGGVREYYLTDSSLTSFSQARKRAQQELTKWASVITDVSWRSSVRGWQVGQTVTINVTKPNTGRTYAGSAVIQEMEIASLGAQKLEYRCHAVETRYNALDHWMELLRQRTRIQARAVPIDIIRCFESAAVVLHGGGSAVADASGPPFRIAPDWGAGTTPYLKIEQSIVDITNGLFGS